MTSSKIPLLSAIALVVLYAVGVSFLGTPYRFEDSPATTAAWLQAHQRDIPVAVVSFSLTMIPFFVVVAWTRRALPDVYGYAFLGAAGAFAAQITVSWWFLAGAAAHVDAIGPRVARGILDVGAYFGPVLTTTDVVMAGAVALAALREGALPRWVGWLSAVFAAEQVVELSTMYGRAGFAAPGGAWNNMLGAGLFMVWLVALGAAVGRRTNQPSA